MGMRRILRGGLCRLRWRRGRGLLLAEGGEELPGGLLPGELGEDGAAGVDAGGAGLGLKVDGASDGLDEGDGAGVVVVDGAVGAVLWEGAAAGGEATTFPTRLSGRDPDLFAHAATLRVGERNVGFQALDI